MDAQLKRGVLDACVLAVLRRGESYGYRLVRDVGEIIDVSESTLYPILKRLESGGLVTVRSAEHNGRLRKYYQITEAGERRVREFLEEYRTLMKVLRQIEGEDHHE
ncbi:MAG: PadR family transcriptional regulator [Clostridia bacterium]|nr:PadR family transcriptional regulator [Clostridia bacterium]